MAEEKPDLTEDGAKPELRQERREDDGTNRRRGAMFGAAYFMILFLVYLAVFQPGLNEFAKTLVNIVAGVFLRELAGMFAAEFGTTRGAEKKDEAIANMTKTAAVSASTAKDLQVSSDKAIALAMVASPETTVASLKAAAATPEKPPAGTVTPGPTTPSGNVPAAEVVDPNGKA